jgi:hypothetical protein
MQFQKINRILKAALSYHSSLRSGSVALGDEMLRGVYTERSKCAQHDKSVTLTDVQIIF